MSLAGLLLKGFGPTTGGSSPPATPVLAVADQGDGTGATATISGADGGTTNTVYVANWPGTAFASKGSWTGNGTVDLAITDLGPKWAFVKSASTGGNSCSSMVHFRVTDSSNAVFYCILAAAKAVIDGLAITGVTAYLYKVPWTRSMAKPGIAICPVQEKISASTNDSDDLGYGVNVVMARVSNQALPVESSGVLGWRDRIERAFLSRIGKASMIAAVPTIYNITIEPGVVYAEQGFSNQHDVTALVVRCTVRQHEGLI